MSDVDEPQGSCVGCRRRDPQQGLVCGPCRSWLAGLIGDLRILHEQLAADEEPVVDTRLGQVVTSTGAVVLRLRDPIGARLPAAPIAAQRSGTRAPNAPESRAPINLDPLDLTGRARQGSRAPAARGAMGLDDDQVGNLPLATVLETWVVDWIVARRPREHRPQPTVEVLTRWLAEPYRLDWACDVFDPIADMAAELAGYRRLFRGQLGLWRFEYKMGVPCANPRCGQYALSRRYGEEWIECGHCGTLMSGDEYTEWVGQCASPAQTAA